MWRPNEFSIKKGQQNTVRDTIKISLCCFQGMEKSEGGAIPKKQNAPFYRNVYLLKKSNFRTRDGQRHLPTAGEIADLRRHTRLEQYKKGVEFRPNMSKKMVRDKLEDTFPYLKNRR